MTKPLSVAKKLDDRDGIPERDGLACITLHKGWHRTDTRERPTPGAVYQTGEYYYEPYAFEGDRFTSITVITAWLAKLGYEITHIEECACGEANARACESGYPPGWRLSARPQWKSNS